MKRIAVIAVALLFGAGTPFPCRAEAAAPAENAVAPAVVQSAESRWELSVSAALEFRSKDVTYGLVSNPHAIILPSVGLTFSHPEAFSLTAGVLAYYDTTDNGIKQGSYGDRTRKLQELVPSLTLSKTWATEDALGSALRTWTAYSYEYHPAACKKPALGYASPNTQYLYAGAALDDLWLVPTLTVEYALDDRQGAKNGIYTTLDIRHTFDAGLLFGLPEGRWSVTPVLGLGIATKDRNTADFGCDDAVMFRDAYGRLETSVALGDAVTLTAYAALHQQTDKEARRSLGSDETVCYGGLMLSVAF